MLIYQRVRHQTILIIGIVMQGGAPPVISWFILPIDYRYNPDKP